MRLVTILSFILCSIVLYGQTANYEIFDVQNFVQVKTRGAEQWNIAKKGNAIGLIDSIKINTNGKVRILDVRTNEVYRSDQPGSYRVKDIRDAAKEQSSKMFAAVCAQIKKDENGLHSDMNIVGATTRGQSYDATDSIAQTIAYLGKILTDNTIKFSSELLLYTHISGDEVYFSMTNNTKKNYCVNVVRYNKQRKKASLCYVINPEYSENPYLLLPAHTSIELPMWRFALPSTHEQYLLIATEHTYDTSHLQLVLQSINWQNVLSASYQSYIVAK